MSVCMGKRAPGNNWDGSQIRRPNIRLERERARELRGPERRGKRKSKVVEREGTMAEARLQVYNAWDTLQSKLPGKRRCSTRCTSPSLTDYYLEMDGPDASYVPGMQLGQSVTNRDANLLYKPYMDYLWNTLTVAAPGLKCQHLDADFSSQRSNKGQQGAEVQNSLFSSSRLRRIRFTYFDAGNAGQAFNSLLYPDYRFDFPLLGIDLLAFGKGKVLCVVDFQPLSQDSSYLEKYTAGLAPIRKDFTMFCSKMSSRIYNENEFFSKQLIFYRSDKGAADPLLQVPGGSFFTTYMGYVTSYLDWLHILDPQDDPNFKISVKKRQADYDVYSCERDPAIKMFSSYFGHKWSERLAKHFLFPLA